MTCASTRSMSLLTKSHLKSLTHILIQIQASMVLVNMCPGLLVLDSAISASHGMVLDSVISAAHGMVLDSVISASHGMVSAGYSFLQTFGLEEATLNHERFVSLVHLCVSFR